MYVRRSANSYPETSGEEPQGAGGEASRQQPPAGNPWGEGTPVRGNSQRRNLALWEILGEGPQRKSQEDPSLWETLEIPHPGRGGDTATDPTRGPHLPIRWKLRPCRAHGVVLANSIVPE